MGTAWTALTGEATEGWLAAQVTGGRLVGAADGTAAVRHVATDSREARPGTLFVAKPGEVTDGHEHVGAAFAAGAVLALVEREVADAAGVTYPGVLVPDVVEAMGRLAAWVVAQLRADHEVKVIAVTGSVGKTTTKDLLRGIFAAEGPTVAPRGSYNGEVGVPLTVFEAEPDTRFLIIEMGATRIGNIDYLCRMVRPDIGVVLCVGSAHAGEFDYIVVNDVFDRALDDPRVGRRLLDLAGEEQG